MDTFTHYMEYINKYIDNPIGMLIVCTAPIVGYYAFKLYIKPLFAKKETESSETEDS